jgi:hypothetical protein
MNHKRWNIYVDEIGACNLRTEHFFIEGHHEGADGGKATAAVENAVFTHPIAPRATVAVTLQAGSAYTSRLSPLLYRDRIAIERMFGRLKDFRRVVTRYDRSATNFLAAVCLAATVI